MLFARVRLALPIRYLRGLDVKAWSLWEVNPNTEQRPGIQRIWREDADKQFQASLS